MSDDKTPIKCDSLENIERIMPMLHRQFSEDTKSMAVGPRVIAPFAESLATIAKELRQLRDNAS